MPDLDDRIRNLVASAVADAPTAPQIDPQHVPAARRPVNWVKRGSLALAALLAAGGGVVALQPADEGDVDTGRDTTATTVVAPVPQPSVIVTAGPDGVREIVGSRERVVTTQPMVMALALDNGDIVAQRTHHSYEARSSGAEAVPVLITTDGTMTPIFDPRTVKGPVDLQDFSVVDGRRLLLYSVYEPDAGPPGAVPAWDEMLYTFDLDGGAITPLDSVGGWESHTSRLHLASTGLIIGSSHGLVGSGSLYAAAIPGSPAASRPLPKASDFGLQENHSDDGCVCPTNFATDYDGTDLIWVSAGPKGDGTAVYSRALDDTDAAPKFDDVRIKGVAELPAYEGVDAVSTFVDTTAGRGVVVSYYLPFDTDGPLHGPIRVEAEDVSDLSGYVATVGHNG